MFKDLKISTRLIGAFGILMALLLAIGAISANRAMDVRDQLVDITGRRMQVIADMERMRDQANFQARALRNIVLFTDPAQVAQEIKLLEESRSEVTRLAAEVEKNITSTKGLALLAETATARSAFREGLMQFQKLMSSGNRDEAVSYLLNDLRPLQLAYMNSIDEDVKFQNEGADEASSQAQASVNGLILTIGVAVLLAAIIAITMAIWIIRSITRPINEAVELARAVAAGDLTRVIEAQSKNETGVLMQALSEMQAGLVKVVSSVRTGSESVSSASVQIAQGNQDLSSRTESQASALEETAASMEQLSSTVRQNADNAIQANHLAQSASKVAMEGGQVVSQVVDTMKGINESSRKIADIISVIDGIAFQTNILALNAAVEAARAGEQGRGFAVVAGEVRNLAQRSAAAAKEIKQLINDSVDRVESGTLLVDKAGSTMSEVVDSVRRVTDIMAEISSASKEQSDGVGQIGEAVTQMDQVTQQNAALVEEMAAAAGSLRSQATELVQTVAVFQLAGHAGQGAFSAVSRIDKPVMTVHKSAVQSAVKRPAPRAALPSASRQPATAKAGAADAAGEWESF